MLGPCMMKLEVTNNSQGGFLDVSLVFYDENGVQEIARESQKVYPNATAHIGPFGMVMRMNGAELFVPIQSFVDLPDTLTGDSLLSGSLSEVIDEQEIP